MQPPGRTARQLAVPFWHDALTFDGLDPSMDERQKIGLFLLTEERQWIVLRLPRITWKNDTTRPPSGSAARHVDNDVLCRHGLWRTR